MEIDGELTDDRVDELRKEFLYFFINGLAIYRVDKCRLRFMTCEEFVNEIKLKKHETD